MKNQQSDLVTLRLESHRPTSIRKSTLAAGRIAREMNLNISALGHYKKKNQLTITLISGPHVHKKSRDQYKIDRYGAFLVIKGTQGWGPNPTQETPSQNLAQSLSDKVAGGALKIQPALVDSKHLRTREKFLEFKNKLYRLYLDEGFSLSFTYLNHEYVAL